MDVPSSLVADVEKLSISTDSIEVTSKEIKNEEDKTVLDKPAETQTLPNTKVEANFSTTAENILESSSQQTPSDPLCQNPTSVPAEKKNSPTKETSELSQQPPIEEITNPTEAASPTIKNDVISTVVEEDLCNNLKKLSIPVEQTGSVFTFPAIDEEVDQFLKNLKKQFKYSNEVACKTVKLLEQVVTNSEWETANDLMEVVRKIGRKLHNNQSSHTVVGNMVKRVLKIIRDEYSSAVGKDDEYDQQESLQKMLVAEEQMDFSKQLGTLRKSISANLRELMEEYERSPQDIAMQSQEHIHFDEVIMTLGNSRTVEKFLKKAASKRKCQVFVAEAAPSLSGHGLAKSLAESGIQTALIQDAAIFAIMPKVNKVIVGTHCVMANGGLRAMSGTHPLALAAKYHSVPFIVLAPMYKLTPQYVTSSHQEGFNRILAPEDILPFEDDELLRGVEVINPMFDYVPPDLCTVLITNIGSNAPSYVYRWLSELYHPDDYEI